MSGHLFDRTGPWAGLPQTGESWPNDFPGGICPLCRTRMPAYVPTLAHDGCIAHESCVVRQRAGLPPMPPPVPSIKRRRLRSWWDRFLFGGDAA